MDYVKSASAILSQLPISAQPARHDTNCNQITPAPQKIALLSILSHGHVRFVKLGSSSLTVSSVSPTTAPTTQSRITDAVDAHQGLSSLQKHVSLLIAPHPPS